MITQQQALELWRHTVVASVRGSSPDLSARQIALLLCVYLSEGPHTVRGLAKDLKISKPAVSRALDRLGELSYIRRERDELDRRNVLVRRTPEGSLFLVEYSNLIVNAEHHVSAIAPEQKLAFALDSMTATAAALGAPTTEQPTPVTNWSDVAA